MEITYASLGNRHKAGTVHLIAVGDHPAITACSLEVGDKLVYNYGYTYTVEIVESTGKGSVKITMRSDVSGEVFTRTRRDSTMVAARLGRGHEPGTEGGRGHTTAPVPPRQARALDRQRH